jgi:N-acetylglucosaminyl-diphospho-decaprenol L-rhamnosyltransferase
MSAVAGDRELTSIVIVAADSGPLLRESVAAALASTANIEVIVVDNASSDGEPSSLSADPRLRVVTNAVNIGFGPACNQAAAFARGDALLFLNPDCMIEADTIARLRAIAVANPSIGLLGVDVRSPDGRSARGNRRRDPTLRRAVMTITGLSRFEARWPMLAGVEIPESIAPAAEVETVEAVSGACMFVTRRAFERVGGFDAAYFLHVEDLDLCRRVRDAGYAVAVAHALPALHAQGSSSRHRPLFVAWHKHRGMWRYFRKFDPAARNPLLRALMYSALWLRFAVAAPFVLLRSRG